MCCIHVQPLLVPYDLPVPHDLNAHGRTVLAGGALTLSKVQQLPCQQWLCLLACFGRQ